MIRSFLRKKETPITTWSGSGSPLIQVLSDLHLEMGDLHKKDFPSLLVPSADILVLAGNIGNPFSLLFEDFLSYCSSHFVHVLFVAGNSEYYGYTLPQTNRLIQTIVNKYPNIHFLNNALFEYNGILFVGSTLWSLPFSNTSKDDADGSVEVFSAWWHDHSSIRDFPSNTCQEFFFRNVEFLTQSFYHVVPDSDDDSTTLAAACSKLSVSPKKIVFITHHPPPPDLLSLFQHSDSDSSSLSELIGWIFGHTSHYPFEKESSSSFLYSNCYRSYHYNCSGCPI